MENFCYSRRSHSVVMTGSFFSLWLDKRSPYFLMTQNCMTSKKNLMASKANKFKKTRKLNFIILFHIIEITLKCPKHVWVERIKYDHGHGTWKKCGTKMKRDVNFWIWWCWIHSNAINTGFLFAKKNAILNYYLKLRMTLPKKNNTKLCPGWQTLNNKWTERNERTKKN